MFGSFNLEGALCSIYLYFIMAKDMKPRENTSLELKINIMYL